MLEREQKFLLSIWNNLEKSEHEVGFVMVDDGTPNPAKVREREAKARRLNCDFIAHGKNLGIPAAWNTVLKYGVAQGADIVGIFNDDIVALVPGTIQRVAYFFEKNDREDLKLGGVGLPLIQANEGIKDDDPRWLVNPGLCGSPVGCSFFCKPQTALRVENPDGSHGFFEALKSFHEEVWTFITLAGMGFYSFMLPWPPMRHWGGQTFHFNQELVWMEPNEFLSMSEFLNYVRQLPFYIPQYEEMYAKGKVDRMSYSRGIFTKYFVGFDGPRIRDIDEDNLQVDVYAEPQKLAHFNCVPKKLDREVFWLDKNNEEKSIIL